MIYEGSPRHPRIALSLIILLGYLTSTSSCFGSMFSWIISKKGMFVNLLFSYESFIYYEVYYMISFTFFTSYSAMQRAVFSYDCSIAKETEAMALWSNFSCRNLSLYFFSIFAFPTRYSISWTTLLFVGIYESPIYGISICVISWISIVSTIALNLSNLSTK